MCKKCVRFQYLFGIGSKLADEHPQHERRHKCVASLSWMGVRVRGMCVPIFYEALASLQSNRPNCAEAWLFHGNGVEYEGYYSVIIITAFFLLFLSFLLFLLFLSFLLYLVI